MCRTRPRSACSPSVLGARTCTMLPTAARCWWKAARIPACSRASRPQANLPKAYTIPRPEGTYSIRIETGEGWVLADTLDGVYAFDYSGGGLVEGPFFDIGGAPGYELLSRPAGEYRYTLEDIYEYDGERLALFLDFAPSDEDEPPQDYIRWQVQTATPSSSARTRWAMSACSSCRAASRPSPRSKYRTRWKCAEPRSPAPA